MSPDGDELWVPVAEGNVVVVADAVREVPVAQIALPGQPRGMAITPDGRYALTVAPKCNQLVVIDRAAREVVQRFGEVVALDTVAIQEYAAALSDGAKLPPVVLFHDKEEGCYWIADGWHRIEAAISIDEETISADVGIHLLGLAQI